MSVKPHGVGRFLHPGARGAYLRKLATAWGVTIADLAGRLQVPKTRVREVFNKADAMLTYGYTLTERCPVGWGEWPRVARDSLNPVAQLHDGRGFRTGRGIL